VSSSAPTPTLLLYELGKVEEMLDTSEDKLKNLPLRSALMLGGKELQYLFGKRSRQLKACVLVLPVALRSPPCRRNIST